MMTNSASKTEPNRTENGFPLYMGKHVFRIQLGKRTEKTDLNRLQGRLNRLTNRLEAFSKTAYNTSLTAFSVLTKFPVHFSVNKR